MEHSRPGPVIPEASGCFFPSLSCLRETCLSQVRVSSAFWGADLHQAQAPARPGLKEWIFPILSKQVFPIPGNVVFTSLHKRDRQAPDCRTNRPR